MSKSIDNNFTAFVESQATKPDLSSKDLPDCEFNIGHLEDGIWVKKKCHCNCQCEYATFGICNDDGTFGHR